MKRIIRKIQILMLVSLCFSCQEERIFELSPSERNAKHINELRKELVDAPYGWSVTYFSRTDSLLFANVKEQMKLPNGLFGDRNKFGYGGHCFLMRFAENGKVETLADYNEQSLANTRESEFEVVQNTVTQLSFTTYNYLHYLVNERFGGSSDFLYIGKDVGGNLIFKTASYLEPAREYIVFSQLKTEEGWPGDIKKAHENRLFFENMKNPQIHIRRAGRTYFRSDMPMRRNADDLQKEVHNRYHLFLEVDYFAPQGWNREVARGLGSGYVGTSDGLIFRPGIRYNDRYIFYDFRREGSKFICELVKVVDPYSNAVRWESKHLAPTGEDTGVIAEIWDEV